MQQEKEFYRRKLPHIQPKGGLFFVTYSLYGSIPSNRLVSIKEEYEMLKNKKGKNDEERKKMKMLARKTYIKNIVETQAKKMTLDETLAPIRQAVENSGLNEDELDGIFQQARREVSQTRKERKKS